MPSLSTVRQFNRKFSPPYVPTAVIVGGTSGIGQGIAEVFGQITNGNSRIIIVGRNRAAGEEIVSLLPKSTAPGVQHEFVQCDVSVMKNVQNATQDILSRVDKINFLALTPGIMTTNGYQETEDGVDKKLAVHYYGRWKFIQGLLPALMKAKEVGEDAKVLTVLSSGRGGKPDLDDLDLKKSYSVSRAAKAAESYNDFMVEEYAERNSELTFIHAAPGGVRTNLIASSPSAWMRAASPIINVLAHALTVTKEECAEYMWYGILNSGKGAVKIGSKGIEIGSEVGYVGSEIERKAVWEHTAKVTHT
ncbi:hypothetical protein BDQ17DRAFT_1246371 [Cyathus striatus]|nr:hypothetical protein BDQ17DRAFT_1246371 [Cyathus striatus]